MNTKDIGKKQKEILVLQKEIHSMNQDVRMKEIELENKRWGDCLDCESIKPCMITGKGYECSMPCLRHPSAQDFHKARTTDD